MKTRGSVSRRTVLKSGILSVTGLLTGSGSGSVAAAEPNTTVTIPKTRWDKTYKSSGGTKQAYFNDIVSTSDGGYVLAGGIKDFRTKNDDPWLVKINGDGSVVWKQYYSDTGEGWFEGVTELSDGSYVVGGQRRHKPDSFLRSPHNHRYILRVDSDGSKKAEQELSERSGKVYDVAPKQGGKAVIAGRVSGSENDRAWVAEVDGSLTIQWQRRFSGDGYRDFTSVKTTDSGEVVLAGEAGDDGFLMKLDTLGNRLWSKTFGGQKSDWFDGVTITKGGKIVAVGETASFGSTSSASWIVSTDPAGNGLWSKAYSKTNDEAATAVVTTPDNNVVVASRGGSISRGVITDITWKEGVLRKIGDGGTVQWKRTYKGTNPHFEGLASDGSVYVPAGAQEGWGVGWVLAMKAVKNEVPTPKITVSPQNAGMVPITFDASQSTDGDGKIQTYAWDLEGDGGFEKTGEQITHEFTNEGSHTVTLRVTDDRGTTATTSVTVDIQNKPPEASFDISPTTPVVNETVQFNASASVNPDGNITTYEWDINEDDQFERRGKIVSVNYSEKGKRNVTLRVTGEEGGIVTAEKQLKVQSKGFPSGLGPFPLSGIGTVAGAIAIVAGVLARKAKGEE